MERYVERERLGEMDPILLSDTSDEEDMPQKTKRRGIAKKRNAGELLPNVFSEK
jgi:hypothetical protein